MADGGQHSTREAIDSNARSAVSSDPLDTHAEQPTPEDNSTVWFLVASYPDVR